MSGNDRCATEDCQKAPLAKRHYPQAPHSGWVPRSIAYRSENDGRDSYQHGAKVVIGPPLDPEPHQRAHARADVPVDRSGLGGVNLGLVGLVEPPCEPLLSRPPASAWER